MFILGLTITTADYYESTTFKPPLSTAIYMSPMDGLSNIITITVTETTLNILGGSYAGTYDLQPSITTQYTICDEDSDCASDDVCNASQVCGEAVIIPDSGSSGGLEESSGGCPQGSILWNGVCLVTTIAKDFVFDSLPQTQCLQQNTYIKVKILNNEQTIQDVDSVELRLAAQTYQFSKSFDSWILAKQISVPEGSYPLKITAHETINNSEHSIVYENIIAYETCELTELELVLGSIKETVDNTLASTATFIKNPIESAKYAWEKKPYHIVIISLIIFIIAVLIGEHIFRQKQNGKKKK